MLASSTIQCRISQRIEDKMPVTATETHLTLLAQQTFLKLWSYPNPFRAPGKEFTDLLVVFGNEILIFSDKASAYQGGDSTTAWRRWYQRTITESMKQLEGAVGQLTDPNATVFVDARASSALPFALPPIKERRLHLIAVAHPSSLPNQPPSHFIGLTFDSMVTGDKTPFRVGAERVKGRLVHLFDGSALELLLTELDTVADFVEYLRQRETAISARPALSFKEPDLLALALEARTHGGTTILPLADENGMTVVPANLWNVYDKRNAAHRRLRNKLSYNVDRLIEHFHEEYIAGRYLQQPLPTYVSHEKAMRHLASESRFGRQAIASALNAILGEVDQRTFWATTVASCDDDGTRYVWLTYPDFLENIRLEDGEAFVLHHLKEHVFVAQSIFPSKIIIGIALPHPKAQAKSFFITILDGAGWDEAAQVGAEALRREKGIFENMEVLHQQHLL
jgi:hypothetical protein